MRDTVGGRKKKTIPLFNARQIGKKGEQAFLNLKGGCGKGRLSSFSNQGGKGGGRRKRHSFCRGESGEEGGGSLYFQLGKGKKKRGEVAPLSLKRTIKDFGGGATLYLLLREERRGKRRWP